MSQYFNKSHVVGFKLLYISCLSFLVLTMVGMIVYPGGTFMHTEYTHYYFLENFFSDLGRTQTPNGSMNLFSLICFDTALIFQAVALFVFNIQFLKEVKAKELHTVFYYIAIVCGILFPVFLYGIAITPCNLFLKAHMFCVRWGFGILVPLSLSYTILVRKHHLLPNKYGNVMQVIVLACFLYFLLIMFGPNTRENIYIQPVAQKVIVYAMVFSLVYLTSGCMRYLHIPTKQEIREAQ
jgi:hypothetical membrane protein